MKLKKRILALLMAFSLLFVGNVTVSAEETTIGEISYSEIVIADVDGNLVDEIEPCYFSSMGDIDKGKVNLYSINVPAGYGQDVIVPVHIKCKGLLSYAVRMTNSVEGTSSYYLYADSECRNMLYTTKNATRISNAGVCYLRIPKSKLLRDSDSSFAVSLAMINGENKVLKNNIELLSAITDYNTPVYYKFTASKTSKVVFTIENEDVVSHSVTLCNSKKRAITNSSYTGTAGSRSEYCVKKGTYYFRVEGSVSAFTVKAQLKTISGKVGKSKKSAQSVKFNGKKITVPVFADSKISQGTWVKFYNPKTQKVIVNVISNFSSGYANIEFYDASGKKYGTMYGAKGLGKDQSFTVGRGYYTSSKRTLPKGNYYIKIVKANQEACGYLGISVKKNK